MSDKSQEEQLKELAKKISEGTVETARSYLLIGRTINTLIATVAILLLLAALINPTIWVLLPTALIVWVLAQVSSSVSAVIEISKNILAIKLSERKTLDK